MKREMLASSIPLVLTLSSLVGCSAGSPPVITPPVERDQYNCVIPPQHVILNKYKITLAGESIGSAASGKIDVTTQPEVINLISEASKDTAVIDYSLCIAVARGDVTTQQQKDHFRNRLHFLSSTPRPTSEQIDKWQKEHPFPLSDVEKWKLKAETMEQQRDVAIEKQHDAELKAERYKAYLDAQVKQVPIAEKARADSNTKNQKSR